MDMHSSRSNKRQRTDSTPLNLSQLPTGVLSNCFSFLGSSGHYYFLASVCKDFKVAVEELYGDDRNTSMDSILTSISTCEHVLELLFVENALTQTKVITAVFENDRLDLFIDVIMKAYRIPRLQNYITAMAKAMRDKSTEIMRFIIKNDEIIYLLKNKEPPEGIQIKETAEDIEFAVQGIAAACDPDMIHQLVEKGVVFNANSIIHCLRREDIETFKCLVDIVDVGHEELQMEQWVIFQALEHEMNLDAIKYLKQKGYFHNQDTLRRVIFSTIQKKEAAAINVVKVVLEGWHDISDDCISLIIILCINEECMDILSYIHESIQRINIDRWIQYAEMENLREVAAHLRSM
ncbi:predicted protein [Chaetoceros tenuissimus]|uniref:Uncharacterized protein n=1 Tax=Chaetoceros tenuissimus TaxID=426638 RepID=A0AAD3CSP4_9STRA|nr:predicted protein [Chaetoceros tenuissimus]